MKKNLMSLAVVLAAVCIMVACGGEKSNPEADRLRSMVDSQNVQMDEMNLFLDAVNVSLDSVINMEGGVLRTVGESPLSRKDQIKQNIEAYKLILQRQHERISELEEKLKNSDNKSAKMLQTIASLKKQLEEKDQAIVELTEELEKRNFDIEELKKNVSSLNTRVTALQEETKMQEEALVAQSDMMNEAYVVIGSSKQLKAAGIVSGGSLFKKSKFDASKVNQDAFNKIDIRKVTSFPIPAKKAEIMTQMPSDSYQFQSNGNGTCTLVITDVQRFWSISNFLVVKY